MNSLTRLSSCCALIVTALAATSCARSPAPENQLRLGLFLYADQTAINASRDGFLDYVRENADVYGRNPEIVERNVGGNATNLAAYADYFATERFDLVVALGTPCAKILAERDHRNKAVFAAPPDARLVGILQDPLRPGGMVTGVTYWPPVARTLEVMRELLPGAKRVGVLHNPAEANSRLVVGEFSKLAESQGWVVVAKPVNDSSEVASAVEAVIDGVDVIFTPNDNTVHTAFATVAERAAQRRKPIVSVDRGSVVGGALVGIGGDYEEIGRIVGELGAELLRGADPATTPVREAASATRVYLNPRVAEQLGVVVPGSLRPAVEMVQ